MFNTAPSTVTVASPEGMKPGCLPPVLSACTMLWPCAGMSSVAATAMLASASCCPPDEAQPDNVATTTAAPRIMCRNAQSLPLTDTMSMGETVAGRPD
ncbi:Uncharacterised protein [Mycobacteroides abscessus subsp. abscessus]|nr:Uncharacterised protein [Mycobacteroides abscessus subsp. abscessus]